MYDRVIRAELLADYASGPFLAACALLVYAGVTKLRGDQRAVGLVEIVVGAAGAATGHGGALTVAVLYVALSGYAWHLLRSAPGTPCNCLGTRSAPVTAAHVGLNAGAATVALAAAFGPSPFHVVAEQPLAGAPFLVLTACCLWLGALVLGSYAEHRAALSVRQGGS